MTDIPHGTLTGHKIHRCRCTPCRLASNRYNRRRERLIAYGQWEFMVDAEPVRQHVQQLREAGLGWARVAALSGVTPSVVSRLLFGRPATGGAPSKRMWPDAAAAILAVHADLDTLADGAQIGATGTRRRIQALACLGWSLASQADRLGVHRGNYARICTSGLVTARTARAVRRLYDELSMTHAPGTGHSMRDRRSAAAKGWVPPLAWDDDTIDDPEAKPNLGATVGRNQALYENSEELIAQGYTIAQAAERLGIDRCYLDKARRRGRQEAQAAA